MKEAAQQTIFFSIRVSFVRIVPLTSYIRISTHDTLLRIPWAANTAEPLRIVNSERLSPMTETEPLSSTVVKLRNGVLMNPPFRMILKESFGYNPMLPP